MYCLLLILLGIFFPANVFAYDLAPGIPDPGFGLDAVRPARPDPWDAEITGYYYVEDTEGCSTSVTYGHPDNPRCYIPDSVPAGSVVEVHGEYTHTVGGIIKIEGTGTSSSPIWIVGENSNNRPVFRDQLYFIGSYIYAENLDSHVTGANDGCYCIGNSGHDGFEADHIMIRNSHGTGNEDVRTTGVKIGGRQTSPTNNVIISNVTLEHFSLMFPQPDHDFDAHIVTIMAYVTDIWVLDSTIHDSAGAGVGIGQETAESTYTDEQRVYVSRNHVYNTLQANIAVKDSHNVVFAQNSLHDPVTRWTDGVYGGVAASPAKCVGYKGEPQNFWVFNNFCTAATYGVHGGGTIDDHQYNIRIVGNVFNKIRANHPQTTELTNPWDEAGISMIRGGYEYAYFNTLFDVPSGINAAGPGGDPGTLYHYEIEGNILQNVNFSHMASGSRDIPSQTNIENNIFYQDDLSSLLFRYDVDYNSLAAFQASGKCSGCVKQDPAFVNASTGDFRITTGSPALDKINIGDLANDPFAAYQSEFGENIRFDMFGAARPTTNADAGAIEYYAASGPIVTIQDLSPLPYTATSATITITTNEAAVCVWSHIPGISFDNQILQHVTTGDGSTSHVATVENLESNENGTNFPIFVLCKDTNDNLSNYATTTIRLNKIPQNYSDWDGNQTSCEYFGGTYTDGVCTGGEAPAFNHGAYPAIH